MTPIVKKIIQLLVSIGFKNITNKGFDVFIYVTGKKLDELKKINSKIPGSALITKSDSKSSTGHVKIGNVNVYVKDSELIMNPAKNEKSKPVTNVRKKSRRAPGFKLKKNDPESLFNFLKKCLEENRKCDFLFYAGTKEFKINQCDKVSFKDKIITLRSNAKNITIDLRKSDIKIPDSFLDSVADKVIDKAIMELKSKLTKFRDYYTIEPSIAVKASRNELEAIKKENSSFETMFGRTSNRVSEDTIIIDSYSLFSKRKVSDMFFEFTSDKDSDMLQNYPGIKVSFHPEEKLDRKTVKIERPRK